MAIQRFQINVSEDLLQDLNYRLSHARFSKQLFDTGWERGTDPLFLESLISYWREQYDWRKQESQLNQFHQYICHLEDMDIHFVHEKGKGPNPIPIILTHGWPDSYLRFKKIIPLLTDPASYGGNPEDAFDVIVPSLPGFGFSGSPKEPGINNDKVSSLWKKLMTDELGYRQFGAAGGDMGSGVTRYLAYNHPESLVGIHLTDVGIIRELLTSADLDLSEEELNYKQAAQNWIAKEGAYMSIQSTKPNTLAYGLSDSPIGLAGWLTEKFHSWSDCNGDLNGYYSMDELITHIMIYWITNTIGSTAHMYYENSHSLPALGNIEVPTGIALFPEDILPPPMEWVKKHYNITRLTTLPRGGHFTAMEEPELLAEEIRAFFRPLR